MIFLVPVPTQLLLLLLLLPSPVWPRCTACLPPSWPTFRALPLLLLSSSSDSREERPAAVVSDVLDRSRFRMAPVDEDEDCEFGWSFKPLLLFEERVAWLGAEEPLTFEVFTVCALPSLSPLTFLSVEALPALTPRGCDVTLLLDAPSSFAAVLLWPEGEETDDDDLVDANFGWDLGCAADDFDCC